MFLKHETTSVKSHYNHLNESAKLMTTIEENVLVQLKQLESHPCISENYQKMKFVSMVGCINLKRELCSNTMLNQDSFLRWLKDKCILLQTKVSKV